MRKTILPKKIFSTGLAWLWITIVIVTIDRTTKLFVLHHLTAFKPHRILPIFNLTLVYNTGAAFSFLHAASGWQNLFFSSLALAVSMIIIYWLYKLPASAGWTSSALCLILGGAFGNMWDRILYGHVIDFSDFHLGEWHFAIFNVADSAICVGAFMLLLSWVRTKQT